jgi:phage terminase Nu1 subunit (DNA packaging protein)
MAGQKAYKITEQTEVTVAELAVILGLSSRRVRQLADEGIIQPVGKNAYLLADSVQSYNKFLSNRMPNEEDVKLEKAKKMAEAQYKASKASIAKLQAQELQGKMHRSEDVAAMTADLIYTVRSALIALPGRLAVNVAAVSTPAEACDIIRREVHLVMCDLSNYKYDPEKYAERVRDRMDWDGGAQEMDDDE